MQSSRQVPKTPLLSVSGQLRLDLPWARTGGACWAGNEQGQQLFLGPWELQTSQESSSPQMQNSKWKLGVGSRLVTNTGNSTKLNFIPWEKGMGLGEKYKCPDADGGIWDGILHLTTNYSTVQPEEDKMDKLRDTGDRLQMGVHRQSPHSALHIPQNRTNLLASLRWPSAWTNPQL